MKIIASFFLSLILMSSKIPDLIPAPAPKPFIEPPQEAVDTKKIKQLESIHKRNSQEEYVLAAVPARKIVTH